MSYNRTGRARALRQASGLAETRVWSRLRGGQIDGHKFRHQHRIGPFYADFACDRLRLVIEIDGGVHTREDVMLRDFHRQQALEALGWAVLRFTNDQALAEPERLVAAVRRYAGPLACEACR